MAKVSFDDVMQTIVTFDLDQLMRVNRAAVALIRDESKRRKLVAGFNFKLGQTVTFTDKRGRTLSGTVIKIGRVNTQVRVVSAGMPTIWRVANTLLRAVSEKKDVA